MQKSDTGEQSHLDARDFVIKNGNDDQQDIQGEDKEGSK
jgi:hypothetical protein